MTFEDILHLIKNLHSYNGSIHINLIFNHKSDLMVPLMIIEVIFHKMENQVALRIESMKDRKTER